MLFAGSLLLLVILYQAQLKPTYLLHNKCDMMIKQIALAKDAPMRVAFLKKQQMEFDHVLGISQNDSINSQQMLLGTITNYCQQSNVLLKEFPKTIAKQEKDYLIETNYFTVEGEFVKLLKLCYQLEQKNKIGKLASVNYLLKKDYKTQIDFLTATVYIQNVKKTTHEN